MEPTRIRYVADDTDDQLPGDRRAIYAGLHNLRTDAADLTIPEPGDFEENGLRLAECHVGALVYVESAERDAAGARLWHLIEVLPEPSSSRLSPIARRVLRACEARRHPLTPTPWGWQLWRAVALCALLGRWVGVGRDTPEPRCGGTLVSECDCHEVRP